MSATVLAHATMKTRLVLLSCFAVLLLALLPDPAAYSQRRAKKGKKDFRARFAQLERQVETEPFVGVTADGSPEPDLFAIRSTGVSTAAVREAAGQFLSALTPAQRDKTTYPVDDPEWRKWMNQHFYVRQGVGFDEISEAQRKAAFGLLRASLSADGLKLTRDIMRLNHTLGELTDNFDEYGEWLYWITVMGEPSANEPWGWQLDGHHVIINYFVLGDQVVMTPFFVGSEPVIAPSGKYKGVAILQAEQEQALAFAQSLTAAQKDEAVIEVSKTGNNNLSEAFKDNITLDYSGLPGRKLSANQKRSLLGLIALFIDNMDDGHAAVKMEEVERHLDRTHFAWVGSVSSNAIFYFRIHSPVLLIEFDHQRPIALGGPRVPSRRHIHAVVRTPNGNDYGKDLLRLHYQQHPHVD